MADHQRSNSRLRSGPAGIACLLLLLAGLHAPVRGQVAVAKPNVLFIAVDDLNAWIGALGAHPQARTPNIDRLAARGTLFRRAYCAAPACNPSRTALLTGRRPSSTGVYDNNQPWRAVLRDAVTLPEHFRANGYRVIGGGKIFHGTFNDRGVWDQYFNRPADPQPSGRPLNGILRTAHFDWGPLDASDEAMGDSKLVDWAAEQLARRAGKPLFLAVGFQKPHLPWYVPRKYFRQHALDRIRLPEVVPNDLDDIPPAGRRMAGPEGDHRQVVETRNWKTAVQGYLASISFADACVGRLLDALDRSPHARNTLIVFWGDHGWHLGEKQHWRKFALWEEANRTPLIIAGPGAWPDTRCDRPVNLIDLYPTLVELCGLSPREGLDGVSLAPLLKAPRREWERPSLSTYHRGNHSLRSDRWRYIRYADGTEELYDHERDPKEWRNVAAEPKNRKVIESLRAWLPKTDAPDAPRRGRPAAE